MNDQALSLDINIPGALRQLANSAEALKALVDYSDNMTSLESAMAGARLKLDRQRAQIDEERNMSLKSIEDAQVKCNQLIAAAEAKAKEILELSRQKAKDHELNVVSEMELLRAESGEKIKAAEVELDKKREDALAALADINAQISMKSDILRDKETQLKVLNDLVSKISG